jgi:arginine/ornithine N-succinyltransferase beta subunit
MMVIRPIERADITALMQLAGKTGGGLTSLPANEATLMARIERSLQTWRGELPKVSRDMCLCWKTAPAEPWPGFAPLRWR